MKTMALKIGGMNCVGCTERVTGVLAKEPGIRAASVSFSAGEGRISYNPCTVEEKRIIEVIERAGFATGNG